MTTTHTNHDRRARAVGAAVAAIVGLTTPSRADAPAPPLADTWRVETSTGAPRVLAGPDAALSLSIDWPSRGLTSLRGCVAGRTLTLLTDVAEGRGLSGALRGDAARSKVVRLSLVGRLTRDADGEAIAARLLEDGRQVGSERWIRPGPAALEIVSVSPGGTFAPKQGPLTIAFRVKNRPIAVRLRAELSGPKVAEFYRLPLPPARHLDGGRVAVVVRDGPELEPGEHTLSWDGRDDSSARRLVLGGPCDLVLEDPRAPREVHDERAITVAEPVVRYLGPRWPKRDEEDLGRDRKASFRAVTEGFRALGYASPDAANRDAVTKEDVYEALSTSAAVVVATHGTPRELGLYSHGATEAVEVPEHASILSEADLQRFDAEARARTKERPFRDVHLVVVWACLAGSAVERDVRTSRPERGSLQPRGFVGLPARLRACGADVVVAFSTKIAAVTHQPFVEALLRRLLARHSIGQASRMAADFADAQQWGNPVFDEEKRAKGISPLKEALVIFPPDTQTDAERLDPACWGSSTN